MGSGDMTHVSPSAPYSNHSLDSSLIDHLKAIPSIFNSEIFGQNGGLLPPMWTLQHLIDVLFPVIFIILFFYTFLNAPLKKRRGAGVSALCTLLILFVVWTMLPTLMNIATGSNMVSSLEYLDTWRQVAGLVPIAAAMSTMLGIALAITSAPFERYRGAGLGIVGFSIVLWVAWVAAPLIIPGL